MPDLAVFVELKAIGRLPDRLARECAGTVCGNALHRAEQTGHNRVERAN
jgi:hypothetical protein